MTWGNGATGVSGEVSAANGLVGAAAGNYIGDEGVTALSNGNYVVASPYWNNTTGAVTWADGATGLTGEVSANNGLVGAAENDFVGCAIYDTVDGYCQFSGITVLNNGNYIVASPSWANGASAAGAGAVTWGSGATGVSGEVSAANSLVGSTAGDDVGASIETTLSNGNYMVISPDWHNGAVRPTLAR